MRGRGATAVAALTVAASVAVLPVPATAHGRPDDRPKAHNIRLTQGADAGSQEPSLSADGRYVVFTSKASNLVRGDTNGVTDVFLRDLRTGRVQRVSTDATGGQSAQGAISGTISAGGRHAVFISDSPDLVPGQTHAKRSVYWRDLRTGQVRYVGNDIGQNMVYARSATVSADGRYVAFGAGTGIPRPGVGIGVRDMRTGKLTVLSGSTSYNEYLGALSDDARVLVHTVGFYYSSYSDVQVVNPLTGERRSVYLTPGGARANGTAFDADVSGNGRYVAFGSTATDLGPQDANGAGRNVFVRDLRTGSLRIVEASDPSLWTLDGKLSRDGRYLLFRAAAKSSDSGIWYLRDLRTGRTKVAVTDASGDPALVGGSGGPAPAYLGERPLDARAGTVAFHTAAENMAPGPRSGDGNDAYVRRIR
ncbi:hypothetical protein [Streptomyces sp. NPDC090994]|uniref:hypothetical protein n=1 Tax=Streptomyces sp. NPDC090994 TaxID=3365969 RepID=UPI00380B8F76